MSEAPSSRLFSLLQSGNVRQLWGCSPAKLRPFLPCLVRMALSPTVLSSSDAQSEAHAQDRKKVVLSLLAGVLYMYKRRITDIMHLYVRVHVHVHLYTLYMYESIYIHV